jgi:hypothetical protein
MTRTVLDLADMPHADVVGLSDLPVVAGIGHDLGSDLLCDLVFAEFPSGSWNTREVTPELSSLDLTDMGLSDSILVGDVDLPALITHDGENDLIGESGRMVIAPQSRIDPIPSNHIGLVLRVGAPTKMIRVDASPVITLVESLHVIRTFTMGKLAG